MKEIGEELGCSAQSVCNLLHKYEIPTRKSNEHTDKTKKKMSLVKTGDNHPFYGKKRPEHSLKMSGRKMPPISLETRNKMSVAKNGLWSGKYKGSDHPYWVEPHLRKATIYKQIRDSVKMQEWRVKIFLRDELTCQICGYKGTNLHVDHIKQMALIVHEQNIVTKEQADSCEELWDINNGRVLCIPCHKQTPTWAKHLTSRKKLADTINQ